MWDDINYTHGPRTTLVKFTLALDSDSLCQFFTFESVYVDVESNNKSSSHWVWISGPHVQSFHRNSADLHKIHFLKSFLNENTHFQKNI